jgi:uncharacterized membrane protein YkoI
MKTIAPFLLTATLLATLPAHADRHHDHERARAALQAGEVLPLQKVLEALQRSHPGDVLEVELEREGGRWIYEVKLLQKGGRLLKLAVDARTAEVLRSRARADNASTDRPEDKKQP